MDYRLKISFDRKVTNHFFSLKCLPNTQPRQTISDMRISLNADYFSFSKDSFGNRFWYGYKEHPHTELNLHIMAKARVDWQEYDSDGRLKDIFIIPTSQTAIGESLLPFYHKCLAACTDLSDNYNKALHIMQMVHDAMTYVSGTTNIKTTAEIAFSQKKGVCQDYAQIMLAVMRAMKIPCRYVAGVMLGENFTHAWVEIFANNRWYGFDPTNNMLINDTYIVFSRGRDYRDCLVNKGIFFSPTVAEQTQTISLSVKEV